MVGLGFEIVLNGALLCICLIKNVIYENKILYELMVSEF